MELLLSLLCLAALFGYFVGNIAVVIIVASAISTQSKAARYALKAAGAMIALLLVNLPPLLSVPTAYEIGTGSGRGEFNMITVLSFCWMLAVILIGWIGLLRDWYLKCRTVRQQKKDM